MTENSHIKVLGTDSNGSGISPVGNGVKMLPVGKFSSADGIPFFDREDSTFVPSIPALQFDSLTNYFHLSFFNGGINNVSPFTPQFIVGFQPGGQGTDWDANDYYRKSNGTNIFDGWISGVTGVTISDTSRWRIDTKLRKTVAPSIGYILPLVSITNNGSSYLNVHLEYTAQGMIAFVTHRDAADNVYVVAQSSPIYFNPNEWLRIFVQQKDGEYQFGVSKAGDVWKFSESVVGASIPTFNPTHFYHFKTKKTSNYVDTTNDATLDIVNFNISQGN